MLQVRFQPFILYLLHWGLKSLALYFCISCTKKWNLLHQVSFLIVSACKMKHWKQKWNIQRVCFMLWNAYKSIVYVQKVKHWNMISRIICVIINCNLSKTYFCPRSGLFKSVFCHGSPGAKNTSICTSVRAGGTAARTCAQGRCSARKLL